MSVNSLLFIGNCVTSFDEDGYCTDDNLPWSDVTEFAQHIDEHGDNSMAGEVTIQYNEETDIHSFFI